MPADKGPNVSENRSCTEGKATIADELEKLWRKAQIDYPVSVGQQGGWIRLRDWPGNYLLTMRANTREAEFVTALVTKFPEILAALRSKK